MKPIGTVQQDSPLIVSVKKNGRPVHEVVAQSYLEKNYPHIKTWKLTKTRHSTLAEEIVSNPVQTSKKSL